MTVTAFYQRNPSPEFYEVVGSEVGLPTELAKHIKDVRLDSERGSLRLAVTVEIGREVTAECANRLIALAHGREGTPHDRP